MQLLLDREGDGNAQGGYYGNALQAASPQGHEMIVQLLLEDQLFVCALITITDFGFDNVTRSH